MEGSVVAVLHPRKPVEPVPRPVPGDAAKVHGDCLVHSLELVVDLRVEGGADPQLDAGPPEEITPNVTGEHRIAVTDYGVRKPM